METTKTCHDESDEVRVEDLARDTANISVEEHISDLKYRGWWLDVKPYDITELIPAPNRKPARIMEVSPGQSPRMGKREPREGRGGKGFGPVRMPLLPNQNNKTNFYLTRSYKSSLLERIKAAKEGSVAAKPLKNGLSSFKDLEHGLFGNVGSIVDNESSSSVRSICLVAETDETTYSLFPKNVTFTSIFGALKDFCRWDHIAFYEKRFSIGGIPVNLPCTLTAVSFLQEGSNSILNDTASAIVKDVVFGDMLLVCCENSNNCIVDFSLEEFYAWHMGV